MIRTLRPDDNAMTTPISEIAARNTRVVIAAKTAELQRPPTDEELERYASIYEQTAFQIRRVVVERAAGAQGKTTVAETGVSPVSKVSRKKGPVPQAPAAPGVDPEPPVIAAPQEPIHVPVADAPAESAAVEVAPPALDPAPPAATAAPWAAPAELAAMVRALRVTHNTRMMVLASKIEAQAATVEPTSPEEVRALARAVAGAMNVTIWGMLPVVQKHFLEPGEVPALPAQKKTGVPRRGARVASSSPANITLGGGAAPSPKSKVANEAFLHKLIDPKSNLPVATLPTRPPSRFFQ